MKRLCLMCALVVSSSSWSCVTNEWAEEDGASVLPPEDELGDEELDVAEDVEPSPKIAGEPGSSCRCDSDCATIEGHAGICVFGVCMTRASATCASGGSRTECAAGSRCWGISGHEGSVCWPDVDSYPGCVGSRDSDGSCAHTTATGALCDRSCASYCEGTSRPSGAIGAACRANTDCGGATCYAGGGWIDGYCMSFSCATASAPCGAGGICVPGLATNGANICMQPCGAGGCRPGYACRTVRGHDICWPGEACSPSNPTGSCSGGRSCVEGACRDACSPAAPDGWCPSGQTCSAGTCVDPSSPPVTGDCGTWECTGSGCSDIVLVSGPESPGSSAARAGGSYLAHGREYSYLRRDLAQLVQWSTCQMTRRFPGVAPLALLDMTTSTGTTPGCPGDCRHPEGTHTGSDLDTAYYQTDGDNNGQCICGDGSARCWNGRADAYSDGYRCTTETNIMNLEQQVWFLAYMARHPGWRVVGVDDTVCEDIRNRAAEMLSRGEIDSTIHRRITSLGCYSSHSSWAFHHHHLHFSFR